MSLTGHRKPILVYSLVCSLVAGLAAIILQDDLRERLGSNYYIIALSLIGCVLLVLAGYVWDKTLLTRLREINSQARQRTSIEDDDDELPNVDDPDEIIGLARQIERMARAMQRAEASYRAIVEDQFDLICRYRADGRMSFVNGAYSRFFGKKRTELTGGQFPLIDSARSTLNRVSEHGGAATFEAQQRDAAGATLTLLWHVRPIHDTEGNLSEYQAVGHDITARQEAETALIQAKLAAESADRAKSEFLSLVSHEIRTPINGVIGFTRLLCETKLTADQAEYAQMIEESGTRLQNLLGDIMDLSRIDTGKAEVQSLAFNLRDVVQSVYDANLIKAKESGLQFDLIFDPGLPVIVQSDYKRIAHALGKLVDNAIKFTRRGSVSITVSGDKGHLDPDVPTREITLHFIVRDTGIGIAAEHLPELGKPFAPLDMSNRRQHGGAGLGLAMATRIARLLGGKLEISSRTNQGTEATLTIHADYERGDSRAPLAVPEIRPSNA